MIEQVLYIYIVPRSVCLVHSQMYRKVHSWLTMVMVVTITVTITIAIAIAVDHPLTPTWSSPSSCTLDHINNMTYCIHTYMMHDLHPSHRARSCPGVAWRGLLVTRHNS